MTYGITGSGAFPAGIWPAGIGEPIPSTVVPTVVFRNIDGIVLNTPQLTGRKIDPALRQYVFDSTGTIVGTNSVSQLVYLAWSTVLGTASVPTLGQGLSLIQTIGPDIQRKVTSILTTAVQSYIDQGLMTILSITVARLPNPTGIFAQVKWRDLTTSTEFSNDVPLASA